MKKFKLNIQLFAEPEEPKRFTQEEVDEMITYNIFYTAITRAKEKLVIYRSPEVEKRVLSNLKKKSYDKDLDILKSIYKTKDTDIFR